MGGALSKLNSIRSTESDGRHEKLPVAGKFAHIRTLTNEFNLVN